MRTNCVKVRVKFLQQWQKNYYMYMYVLVVKWTIIIQSATAKITIALLSNQLLSKFSSQRICMYIMILMIYLIYIVLKLVMKMDGSRKYPDPPHRGF